MLQPEVAYEWSYGIVYSPKWLKGLTLSADWWHIDMRSLISSPRHAIHCRALISPVWCFGRLRPWYSSASDGKPGPISYARH